MNTRHPRTTTLISEPISHRLSTYAVAATAAGVGALALAQPAQAKIIYTPAHQKVPIGSNFYLDLNHDKINDFALLIRLSSLSCGRAQTCSSWDAAAMFAYPQVKGNALVGKPAYASALKGRVVIGPKDSFNTSRGIMGGVSNRGQQLIYSGPWANSGKELWNHYLGFKFTMKGKTHYGWARLNVRVFRDPKSTVKAVLTGYAYETVPNKPIVTGKTQGSDVIQSATLGQLAGGVATRTGQ